MTELCKHPMLNCFECSTGRVKDWAKCKDPNKHSETEYWEKKASLHKEGKTE